MSNKGKIMGNTKNKKVKNKSIIKSKDLIQLNKNKSYKKTLIVGHSLSDFEVVTELLSNNGMELASPLKKEGITAVGISDILENTYITDANREKQLNIDPVWNGLALDLFMSNRKHEWWGWSDERAILLLDYWKSIDAKMGFVFAYATPQKFILNFIEESDTFSKKSFKKAVDEWCSYHRTLLHFYYRNMDRSLLVNTQQVEVDSSQYLQQINKQLGVKRSKMQKKNLHIKPYAKKEPKTDAVLSCFIEDLVQEYPMMIDLFEELQAVANLPYKLAQTVQRNPIENIKSLVKQQEKQSVLKTKLKSRKKHYKSTLKKVVQKNTTLINEWNLKQTSLEDEKNALSSNLQKHENALKEAKKETEVLQQSKAYTEKELSTENDLLLTQLHLVQEELETFYLENSSIKKRLLTLEDEKEKAVQETIKTVNELTSKQTNLEVQKQDLSSKLQKAEEALRETKNEVKHLQQKKAHTEKELSTENDILLTQLHHVQEELEKYYLENQRLKEKREEQKRHYGAAERIKRQLSYRLGAKMIEKSHSFLGILGLPFSLRKVYIEYKKDMKERRGKKLPPIERYVDAYEAERVKGHLSYMLGQTTIKTMKNPFGVFVLPFRLIATQKAFEKSRTYNA